MLQLFTQNITTERNSRDRKSNYFIADNQKLNYFFMLCNIKAGQCKNMVVKKTTRMKFILRCIPGEPEVRDCD